MKLHSVVVHPFSEVLDTKSISQGTGGHSSKIYTVTVLLIPLVYKVKWSFSGQGTQVYTMSVNEKFPKLKFYNVYQVISIT